MVLFVLQRECWITQYMPRRTVHIIKHKYEHNITYRTQFSTLIYIVQTVLQITVRMRRLKHETCQETRSIAQRLTSTFIAAVPNKNYC